MIKSYLWGSFKYGNMVSSQTQCQGRRHAANAYHQDCQFTFFSNMKISRVYRRYGRLVYQLDIKQKHKPDDDNL